MIPIAQPPLLTAIMLNFRIDVEKRFRNSPFLSLLLISDVNRRPGRLGLIRNLHSRKRSMAQVEINMVPDGLCPTRFEGVDP